MQSELGRHRGLCRAVGSALGAQDSWAEDREHPVAQNLTAAAQGGTWVPRSPLIASGEVLSAEMLAT